jgi:NAD(P)-dependent dehydrogenase (short-subunit alcohol dehydrogenase family)
VIPQEYRHLSCRSIDVEAPVNGWDDTGAARLARELLGGSSDHAVAYRGAYRWVQSFEPWPLAARDAGASLLRDDGAYLVTGGLGGIGLEVAEFLARAVRARLVLVGRSPLPARAEWESFLAAHDETDEASRRIRRIQALEALGSEVLVLAADAADLSQMRGVVAEAEARFGSIHGVVHALGAEKVVQLITEVGPSEAERQFRPRLQGAEVLEQVLEGRPLDFCLLISSLSAVLGAVGSVAYTAAHVFLDAFAARHNRTSAVPWLSVNWDRWFTWREAASAPTASEGDYSMTPEEAQEALGRVLSSGNPAQLVVSTGDLQARVDRWIRLPSSSAAEDSRADRRSAYSRPDLVQAYVAPGTPEERTLAGIWCEALGLEKVGVNDDFFELGGDSVLGLRIVAKANEAGVRLTGRHIFEHHTIAELAAAVAGAGNAPAPRSAVAGDAETAVAFPAARLNEKQLETVLTKLSDGGTQPK